MHEFTIEAMIRGYHVYQTVWKVSISKALLSIREPRNQHDPHAVAVIVLGAFHAKCLTFVQLRTLQF